MTNWELNWWLSCAPDLKGNEKEGIGGGEFSFAPFKGGLVFMFFV